MNKIKMYLGVLVVCSSLFISSCGTIWKHNFVEHTGELDYYVVFLDSLGLMLFVVPGVVALSVDYITGTLFLTEEQKEQRDYPISPQRVRELIQDIKIL